MTSDDQLTDVADHVDDQLPEPAPLDEWPGDTLRNAAVLDPELDQLDVDDQVDDEPAGESATEVAAVEQLPQDGEL